MARHRPGDASGGHPAGRCPGRVIRRPAAGGALPLAIVRVRDRPVPFPPPPPQKKKKKNPQIVLDRRVHRAGPPSGNWPSVDRDRSPAQVRCLAPPVGHRLAHCRDDHESVHLGMSIDRPADEVYAYVTDPPTCRRGPPVSPEPPPPGRRRMGRRLAARTRRRLLRCPERPGRRRSRRDVAVGRDRDEPDARRRQRRRLDVVFSVRRRPEMTDADFAADVDAVSRDLAARVRPGGLTPGTASSNNRGRSRAVSSLIAGSAC